MENKGIFNWEPNQRENYSESDIFFVLTRSQLDKKVYKRLKRLFCIVYNKIKLFNKVTNKICSAKIAMCLKNSPVDKVISSV